MSSRSKGRASEVYVDVTSAINVPRFTGIQRVMAALFENSQLFIPVRFDSAHQAFIRVDRERLKARADLYDSFRAVPLIQSLIWALCWRLLRISVPNSTLEAVAVWARARYNQGLGIIDEVPETIAPGDIWAPNGEPLWLFEIPTERLHLDFLMRLAKGSRIRLLAYVYDLIPVESRSASLESRPQSEILSFAKYLNLIQYASSVGFLSEYTLKRFLRYFEHNGLVAPANLEVIYPPKEDRKAISKDVKPPPLPHLDNLGERPLILMITPLTKRKNALTVFRAYAAARKAGQPGNLVCVAPGSAHVDIKTVWTAIWLRLVFRRSVFFITAVGEETLFELYRRAHIVCAPSVMEGFGLPLAEGYRAGSHLLCSDAGALQEVGSTLGARLISPFDVQAWKHELAAHLSRPKANSYAVDPQPTGSAFAREILRISQGNPN